MKGNVNLLNALVGFVGLTTISNCALARLKTLAQPLRNVCCAKPVGLLLATLTTTLSLSLSLAAGQMDLWHQAYPRPTDQNIWDVATDGTNWVAVGAGGAIVVSPDATNWAAVNPTPTNQIVKAVLFAANRWVAVGFGGAIVTSTNAADWVNCPSGTTETFYGVSYGNGRFLAVGSYGAIASSTNGSDWQLESNPNPSKQSLLGLAFGKGIFVTGGSGGVLQTSADGVSWAQTFTASQSVQAVFFDGDLFLAGLYNGLVYASADGTNWTYTGFSALYPKRFAKFQGTWYCAAGYLWQSSDLTNWTSVPTDAFSSSSSGGTYNVTASGGTLLITGEEGNLLVSTDGTNYLQCRQGRPLPLASVVRHGNRLIVPSLSADRLVLTSEDGWNWTERPFGATANQSISDGQIVITVGTRGSSDDISVSTNGLAWTPIPLRSRSGLYGVTTTSSGYAAVGGGGVVYTSSDGTHWTSNAIPGAPALKSVVGGSTRIVAVGPPKTNYFSDDGMHWTAALSSTTNQLLSVAFGAGRFVAAGARGTVARSDDGAAWQSTFLGGTLTIKRVIFANNQFVAATTGNTFTSPDGASWRAETNAPSNLKDISYAQGAFATLSASTYSAVSISGEVPLWLTGLTYGNDELIRIGTSSAVGEVYALEFSPDAKTWGNAILMTNALGYGSAAMPLLGPVGLFRMRATSSLP